MRVFLSFNDNGGEVGVLFFFVLSGFLITYLMIRERETKGRFSVPGFYWRRICRIWPLYFLTLLVGFIAYPYLASLFNKAYVETADPWLYVFFLANVNSYTNGFSLGVLGVQWSVAIEEQFYLIWPLVFVFFSRTGFIYFVGLLLLVANVFIVSNIQHGNYIYFHSLSAVNELAMGGLVANLAYHKPMKIQVLFSRIPKSIIAFNYLVGITFLFFNKELIGFLPFLSYIRKPLMALFFVFVLIEQTYAAHSVFKLRKFKILSFLGKISYGIYLLHMVAIQVVLVIANFIQIPIVVQIAAVLGFTFLMSYWSYKYFERYFLNLKSMYSAV